MVKMARPRIRTADLSIARLPPKVVDPIYQTREYQQWRAIVIARAGGVCQFPGCGRKEPRMFADHIEELKDGGDPYDPGNGQCLCGSHHTLKTNEKRAERHRKYLIDDGENPGGVENFKKST